MKKEHSRDADGALHSRDGDTPAIDENGLRAFYRHGLLHRATGPAVQYPDGREEYRVDGRVVTKELFEALTQEGVDLNSEEGSNRVSLRHLLRNPSPTPP